MSAQVKSSQSKLARAALWYATQFGWRVFPLHTVDARGCSCKREECGAPGKHPRTQKGCLDATSDAEQVKRWWTQWPDANVGVATGRGLVVVDIDPAAGGDNGFVECRKRLGALPDTVEALTGGGGRHIYLATPAGVEVRNSASTLARGVDVRGDGGYVVAAPSVHASGKAYAWEASSRPEEVEVAAAPLVLTPLCFVRSLWRAEAAKFSKRLPRAGGAGGGLGFLRAMGFKSSRPTGFAPLFRQSVR